MILKMFQTNNRQNGMALILAIGFLAVLSILGAVVMRVSTLDLKNTAQFLPEEKAFYLADSVVEYALNDEFLNSYNSSTLNGADMATISLGETKAVLEVAKLEKISLTSVQIPDRYEGLVDTSGSGDLYHLNVTSKPSLGRDIHIEASILKVNLLGKKGTDGND